MTGAFQGTSLNIRILSQAVVLEVHTKSGWGYVMSVYKCNLCYVALGGLVVSVLATGPKARGFKPGRGRWILRVIKFAAPLPSEGKKSRRSHVVDLRHVKEPYEHDRYSSEKFSGHVFHLLRH
jgi:hypothetical protein